MAEAARVALRRRASSPCIKQGGETPQIFMGLVERPRVDETGCVVR